MCMNRRFQHANKVVGYMAESSTYYAPGRDMSELFTYVNARLLWNVSRSSEALIDRFLSLYYGEAAAPHIYAYHLRQLNIETVVAKILN